MLLTLFCVSVYDSDKSFRGIVLHDRWLAPRIDNVKPHVSLQRLRHQAINRASACGNGLQDSGAVILAKQGFFDGIDLALDSIDLA
jgi:hypothetical protein